MLNFFFFALAGSHFGLLRSPLKSLNEDLADVIDVVVDPEALLDQVLYSGTSP